MVDNGTLLKIGAFEFSNNHPEDDIGLTNRIDARRDRAVVEELVGRCVDLRIGWKGDREGVVGIAVFLPALRRGGAVATNMARTNAIERIWDSSRLRWSRLDASRSLGPAGIISSDRLVVYHECGRALNRNGRIAPKVLAAQTRSRAMRRVPARLCL
jgi:hypothetical protein